MFVVIPPLGAEKNHHQLRSALRSTKYHSNLAKYAELFFHLSKIRWYFSISEVVLNIYTVPERQLISVDHISHRTVLRYRHLEWF